MKKILFTVLAAIGAFGMLAVTPLTVSDAEAQHHRHHGSRIGVYIGAPLVFAPWPYYSRPYYDPYYYPRTVVIREQPVVYTEQTVLTMAPPPPAPPAQQQYWYFCQDTQTYYPYVQNCAAPWQRVIPHAPR